MASGVSVRFMQEEYFPRQADAFPGFTATTGIAVDADFLPVDRFWRDARRSFGDPPIWDLLVPDEVIVAEAMARDRLTPLDEWAERDALDLTDWLPAGIDRFRSKGALYAIPYVAMSNVLISRQDILDRYDLPVPMTWDELHAVAAAAQRALRADGVDDVVGFVSRGLAGYGHNFWIIGSTLFPSWGWSWDRGPAAPPLIDQPETRDALAAYVALLRECGPANASRMTFTDTHRHYADGKAVFLLDAATELATMRRAGPNGVGAGATSTISLVPSGPTRRPEPGLYSPAFCIPRSSPSQESAWRLLAQLASREELMKDAIDAGYAETVRQSILVSTAYAAAFDLTFREVVRMNRELGRINRPLIPNGFDLGEIVGAAAEAAIADEQTPSEALRAAQTQIDAMDWA